MDRTLAKQLRRVGKRLRTHRLVCRLAICWATLSVCGLGLWLAAGGDGFAFTHPSPVIFSGVLIGMAALGLTAWKTRTPSMIEIAREIERALPDLCDGLLAAVEQSPDLSYGSFLQLRVMQNALKHCERHDWRRTVPAGRQWRAVFTQFAALALYLTVIVVWAQPTGAGIESHVNTGERVPVTDEEIGVEPGDAEIERGSSVIVTVRFNDEVPRDVVLVAKNANGVVTTLPLAPQLGDPVCAGRMEEIREDVIYHIEYANRRSDDYRLRVFDFPEIQRIDAKIVRPEYTALPPETVEDTQRVTVVEGSAVTLSCALNKPVRTARLIEPEAGRFQMLGSSDGEPRLEITLRPKTSSEYIIEVADTAGRKNKLPPSFFIDVVPNRRPDLKLAFPAKDLRVSPLEEINIEATAWDDFGLLAHGVQWSVGGNVSQTVVLGDHAAAATVHQLKTVLSLESLGAEPDQLVSYCLFADDFGPDGQTRRTYSDIFFAEVRHFEEIFRQGQAMQGGGPQMQGGGKKQKKIEDLTKLQKQIVSATWNLLRREPTFEDAETLKPDVTAIADSQQAVSRQAEELGAKLKDAKSKAHLQAALNQMRIAVEQLQNFVDDPADALSSAHSAERSAYQSLLKLRAREHRVSKGQGGGGGGGGAGQSKQQMNQLELNNKQNRYQTERSAQQQSAKTPQREQLRVLNRLRELARRQQSVNNQLRELEHALRTAKTEQQREEIKRRLKRLQEEQQQMLRDVDEVKQEMNKKQMEQQLADARKKLDTTRDRLRQSSDALEKGQLSKALSAGRRAERQFQDLKNDVRKRTAHQFADALKDLKRQSTELSEKHQKLERELKQPESKSNRSLGDGLRREELSRKFQQEAGELNRLTNDMRKVIEQAETTEPLLSKKLYDSVRKSQAERPEQSLKQAATSARRGKMEDATAAAEQAGRGIERMKQGINQAAKSVLGDELESLKQARRDLDDLAKAVQSEIGKSAGKPSSPSSQETKDKTQPIRTASRDSQSPATRKPSSSSQKPGGSPSPQGRSGSKQFGGKSPSPMPGGQSQSPMGGSGSKSNQPGKSSSQGGNQPSGKSSGKPSPTKSSSLKSGGVASGPGGGPGSRMGPITGNDFRKWSDRLRDVEEMVEDPQLRAEAARIREAARSMRVEFKRHARVPNWDAVNDDVLKPLVELQNRVAEEVAKRETEKSTVPIDRDPVPPRFAEVVRKYYERLGTRKRD